jgi:tRNA-specific 2-thiouridylase
VGENLLRKTKVLVGLSGGIDSSMSAYLLKKDGYEVEGVYMILHQNDSYHQKNIQIVEKVVKFLDIKYHILDLSKEFERDVYIPFIQDYKDGITPNPCVVCNKEIKFGKMYEFMKSIKCDLMATGHYVKVENSYIYEAFDKSKDQSYFLAQVDKSVLDSLIFPLSGLTKERVKEYSKDIEVLNEISQNRESQEICFVENSYIDILKNHFSVDKKGDVYTQDGKMVGEHKGYMHYTIGKRKGFRVYIAHEPHYVLKINPNNNSIVVGKKDELLVKSVVLDSLNFFDKIEDNIEFESTVKLRYRTKKAKCRVTIKESKAFIELIDEVYGVATGQIGVLYDNDRVLGSGRIIATDINRERNFS